MKATEFRYAASSLGMIIAGRVAFTDHVTVKRATLAARAKAQEIFQQRKKTFDLLNYSIVVEPILP